MVFVSVDATKWAKGFTQRKAIIASPRDLTVRPFLFGEDYYISGIAAALQAAGVSVDSVLFRNGKIWLNNRQEIGGLSELVTEPTLILLHSISPYHVVGAKLFGKARVVVPVFYFWNNVLSTAKNLKDTLGNLFWQPFADEFILPSDSEAARFRRIGLSRKTTVVPINYSCPHCASVDYEAKKALLAHELPEIVTAVYIGSMMPKRFNLENVVASMNQDQRRRWRLSVYTASEVAEKSFEAGNVVVSVFRKTLDDAEKCHVLRDADVFVAPAEHTTMQPPLSVMEAEYHGNVVYRQ